MHPLCQRCGKALARQVHHRVAIAAGGDPWDTANLMAVCLRCHADLEREERRKRKGGSNCG
jgi:5-methylcytosine-specific restriction endonuclease McrA